MKTRQSGATIVEFSFVLIIFLVFLLGVLDFSRLLYTWSVTNEATRAGARYAVVCADTTDSSRILAAMQQRVPQITSISVVWDPAPCTATGSPTSASCEGVTVSVTGLQFKWVTPLPRSFAQKVINLPSFSTYLPREMMRYDSLIC
jgi:Flp pilus assembly protein TadG